MTIILPDQFRFLRDVFYFQLKSKIDNILTKSTVLPINLDDTPIDSHIDDTPIDSHTHTHTSHPQTSLDILDL